MRHYETIHTEDTRGFHVIFSVTPEDFHPRDCFDETVEDISEICSKIVSLSHPCTLLKNRDTMKT